MGWMGRWGAVLAVAASLALTACGGAAKSSQPTLAHVCASHPDDVGTIAAGLFAFKEYMESGDPSQASTLSSVSLDTASAIADLQVAAVGATSSNLPAMRAFLQDLQDLSGALSTPATVPTAVQGDQDVSQIQGDAQQAGCPIGGSRASTAG